jgi:small subunit ribosomal protein S17
MADENVNEETQDEVAAEAETTDAPEGVADVENAPVRQVPEGDTPGSADEAPQASAEPADAEPLHEPAETPPPDEAAEPAEQAVAEAESAEEPAEGAPPEEATGDEPAPIGAAATADAPEAADAAETPAPAKRKKKRLSRALRPARTKPRRERSAERKPITRLPKPEHERGRRQERQGTVVSANADKTIVVRVDVVKLHPRYKKVVKRSTKLHAHDEANQAKVGDVVRLVETRPLSKLKRWRLREIVEEAK